MNKILYVCVIIFLLGLINLSCKRDHLNGDVEETLPTTLTEFDSALNNNSLGFYIGLPQRYYTNSASKKYPLIVCFPGAGAYGSEPDQLKMVLSYGIPKLINEHRFPPSLIVNKTEYSFIVLAPHFIAQPSNSEIRDFVNLVKNNYRIDFSRIYFVGVSVGGRMASSYAGDSPEEIAALVTMAGGLDFDVTTKCERLANSQLPIWVFHNRDDQVWPLGSQINFISSINSFNPIITPRFTIFDIAAGDKSHDAWTRASDPSYKEFGQNIYEWMLSYKR